MSVCISVCLSVTVKTQERHAKTLCCPSYFFMFCMILENGVHYLTLKEETLSGRNFRKSPKSRNFANLGFANFVSWRKFMEKTIVIFWKSLSSDGNNFREWLGKGNNDHFKSLFSSYRLESLNSLFFVFPSYYCFFKLGKNFRDFWKSIFSRLISYQALTFTKMGQNHENHKSFCQQKFLSLVAVFRKFVKGIN